MLHNHNHIFIVCWEGLKYVTVWLKVVFLFEACLSNAVLGKPNNGYFFCNFSCSALCHIFFASFSKSPILIVIQSEDKKFYFCSSPWFWHHWCNETKHLLHCIVSLFHFTWLLRFLTWKRSSVSSAHKTFLNSKCRLVVHVLTYGTHIICIYSYRFTSNRSQSCLDPSCWKGFTLPRNTFVVLLPRCSLYMSFCNRFPVSSGAFAVLPEKHWGNQAVQLLWRCKWD